MTQADKKLLRFCMLNQFEIKDYPEGQMPKISVVFESAHPVPEGLHKDGGAVIGAICYPSLRSEAEAAQGQAGNAQTAEQLDRPAIERLKRCRKLISVWQ